MEGTTMFLATRSARLWSCAVAAAVLALAWPVSSAHAAYPPANVPPPSGATPFRGTPTGNAGPFFTNTHFYGQVDIKVEVYNNYLGDFTKYWWVYTVTNHTYDPVPGTSNGFSGFELALPVFVPDIANVAAPDGIPPWAINCCSGQPVEWDLSNAAGAPVLGGTLPGQTEKYSFTTLPRLITLSTGWFHTWENEIQTDLVYYPPNDAPEVPDLLAAPNQELCCSTDATGAYVCQVLAAGQCTTIGGTVVPDCAHCPPITPTIQNSWGKLKDTYRR
jgi:hypothetical protein